MSSYQTATIDLVARALSPHAAITPREVQGRLPFDFSRGSIRQVLTTLVREGRASVEGGITQKRYRAIAQRAE